MLYESDFRLSYYDYYDCVAMITVSSRLCYQDCYEYFDSVLELAMPAPGAPTKCIIGVHLARAVHLEMST